MGSQAQTSPTQPPLSPRPTAGARLRRSAARRARAASPPSAPRRSPVPRRGGAPVFALPWGGRVAWRQPAGRSSRAPFQGLPFCPRELECWSVSCDLQPTNLLCGILSQSKVLGTFDWIFPPKFCHIGFHTVISHSTNHVQSEPPILHLPTGLKPVS